MILYEILSKIIEKYCIITPSFFSLSKVNIVLVSCFGMFKFRNIIISFSGMNLINHSSILALLRNDVKPIFHYYDMIKILEIINRKDFFHLK